jgi:hypothetical protein
MRSSDEVITQAMKFQQQSTPLRRKMNYEQSSHPQELKFAAFLTRHHATTDTHTDSFFWFFWFFFVELK